jgi:hypothetical protein
VRAREQGKWKNGGRIITFRVGVGVAFLNPRVTCANPYEQGLANEMKWVLL